MKKRVGVKKSVKSKNKSKKSKMDVLIISFIIMLLVGILGSFFTADSVRSSWYESVKPRIAPPGWVFSVVWTLLFIMITLSIYYSWIAAYDNEKKFLVILFSINLGLNVLWSYVYFGLREILIAFYVLILLWISILFLVIYLWRIERRASWLLVPYLVWVSFAGILNYFSYLRSVFI